MALFKVLNERAWFLSDIKEDQAPRETDKNSNQREEARTEN